MKAQASTEYLMMIGVVLLIIIPLLFYGLKESREGIQLNQAEDTVATIANAVDTVYSIGPGAKKLVWVNIPGGVEGASLENKDVLFKVRVYGNTADIFSSTKALLAGSLPIDAGPHRISIEMLDSGYVQIGIADDTMPPSITWSEPRGTINYNGIILRANTNEPSTCKYDDNDAEYSSMANLFEGAAITHESDLGVLADGNYLFYARCIDPSSNVMENSAVINFTITTAGNGSGDPYEEDLPVVSLVAPLSNTKDSDGLILFQYNVTDASSITFCELTVNNTIKQTDNTVTRNITETFSQTLDLGYYRWHVNCSDSHGNEGMSVIRNISVNVTLDDDLPVVSLIAPANGAIRNYWLIKFTYTATDASSGINYCDLNINGLLDNNGTVDWSVRDTPVVEGAAEDITMPLFKGNYTWNVSCVDTSILANKGASGTRSLRINLSAGEEAFIDSCAGWCGWQGMTGGVCENSVNKCADNCGLPYSSTHDCYAGDDISQQFCTGGTEADTCCCLV